MKAKRIIFIALLIIAVGAGIAYYVGHSKLYFVASPKPTEFQPTLQQTEAILEKNADLLLPDTSTFKQVTSPLKLDTDLQALIPIGITADTYTQISNTRIVGYKFVYSLSKNVNDAYNQVLVMMRTSPFNIRKALRANLAAIITAESPRYWTKVVFEKVDDTHTNVTAQVQVK